MSTAQFPVVLVMLALDEHDPSVLDAVADSAERFGARTIILSHVSPMDPLAGALGMGLDLEDAPNPPGLEAARDALKARVPGVDIDLEHAMGAPDFVLADIIERRDVDLLVIGRLQSTDGTPGWGPSGQSLLRTINCSALVVPQGSRVHFGHAVVGLDFSNHASHALAVAARIFDKTTAVCQYDLSAAGHGSLTDAEFTKQLTANAREHYKRAVLPQLPPDKLPTLEVLPGDMASKVLVSRSGKQMLVVGSRGLTKLATLLLGSTAERLAGISPAPVLIVRKKGEVLGLLEGLFHR